ncbi:DUF2982 domain-containing protein [Motilimonas eburnea]|uniref:DUF2982 domain-containing protein n=1 Tax=Motilimonas eburnea TaxID=1737488 RepID=UPI001E515FA3|nr:DUF2982 domain-containing protein [Motilimonas eburnea]MCE2570446.1 DUF2982 domain-containing protein [Motilimonas eburnea]
MLLLSAMLSWPQYSLSLLLLLLVAFISMMLGIAKIVEPQISIKLDENGLTYFHSKGCFSIPWQDIQRVDIPTLGYPPQQLAYLGIKLKRPEALLESISPRLCSHFIVEQRALLILAMRHHSDCPSCASDHLFDVRDYVAPDKTRYRGLNGMLGHRIRLLNQLLGYHIYLSSNCLDRPIQDFLPLLRQYQQQAIMAPSID